MCRELFVIFDIWAEDFLYSLKYVLKAFRILWNLCWKLFIFFVIAKIQLVHNIGTSCPVLSSPALVETIPITSSTKSQEPSYLHWTKLYSIFFLENIFEHLIVLHKPGTSTTGLNLLHPKFGAELLPGRVPDWTADRFWLFIFMLNGAKKWFNSIFNSKLNR